MSDRHEERLLNELLGDIARADRELRAPTSLEARVMSGLDRPAVARPRAVWVVPMAIAAALIAAMGVSLRHRDPSHSSILPPRLAYPQDRQTASRTIEEPHSAPPAVQTARPVPVHVPSVRPHVDRQPRVAEEVVDFIPLGPMTPGEVSRSFQIVPVRINNTPAHLLLGEDGIAQGILWRSR